MSDRPQPTTLSELVFHLAETQGDVERRVAAKRGRQWHWLATRDLVARIHHLALALEAEGIQHGDRVALFSENCPEWHIVDLACQMLGAVTVPIYPTLPASQVSYILADSESKWAFFRGAAKGEMLASLEAPRPATVSMLSSSDEGADRLFDELVGQGGDLARSRDLESLRGRVADSDLASLIYTSGTTGNPKGVMLTHRNLTSNYVACADLFPLGPEDVTLSFLPLSHVFQRTVDYLFLYKGVVVHYLTAIEQAPRALTDVRPTIMASVPRLYERAYLRVMANIQKEPARSQRIFKWAVSVGERYSERPPRRLAPVLSLQRSVAQRLVYEKIQQRLGGRLRFAIAGGAALPERVGRFFAAVGIDLYEGYGLTESSPVLCVNRPGRSRFGTVGPTIPGVELRIADDGEILAKGPGVMKGYWRNAEATAEALDAEGWLHTGDVGKLDADGFLHITDRKKDLLVTSGGKNIAPQPIEQLLTMDGVLSQAVVIGDGYPYITALLVPNLDDLDGELAGLGASEIVVHPRLLARVEETVAAVNRQLAEHERVRRWKLMEQEFSLEAGEITPTLKVRRRVVLDRYADLIDTLYLKSQRLDG